MVLSLRSGNLQGIAQQTQMASQAIFLKATFGTKDTMPKAIIDGPMIFATDNWLEPEVPKGARLLVNEKKTKVDENGCYVFRRIDGSKRCDIAIVELLDDGTYRYTYANKKPEIRSDLSELELIGQVWEAQTMVEIADGGTIGNGKLVPPKDPNEKFKVWFPFWTAV